MPGPCPICHAAPARLRYRLPEFSIFDCGACGQTFLDPLPSAEEIERLFHTLYTSGDCGLPELKGYYDFCYDDSPTNPLVQGYERWLALMDDVETANPGLALAGSYRGGIGLGDALRSGLEAARRVAEGG